jgi:hypothetical protein
MTVFAAAPTSTAEDAPAVPDAVMSRVRVVVEYWTVTMDGQASCGSCDQTLTAVAEAVDDVRPLAERIGLAVEIQPRSVATWAEAMDQQIVASPTIRAAGVELRPDHSDESEARRWEWRGTTTSSVRPEAVLDFLIQAVSARSWQLAGYLSSGGPAGYVRQYLQDPPAYPTTPESDPCGCNATCR